MRYRNSPMAVTCPPHGQVLPCSVDAVDTTSWLFSLGKHGSRQGRGVRCRD